LSRTRLLIGVLLAGALLALLLHALPLLLWHLQFERELAALGHPERLHAQTRDIPPQQPEAWTELRVDNFSLRAPLAANQRVRCAECALRCLLRLESAGSLVIFDAPTDESYENALDRFAPDADDLSLLRSVARNWQTIDAITDRARNSTEVVKSFRFTTPTAKGIVSEFRVENVSRFVVYAYAPSGESARMIGLAGIDLATLERLLGSLRIDATAPARFGESSVRSACGPAGDAAPAAATRGSVVLLHGLGRSAASMAALEAALGERGYRVINLDYASRHHSIDELVEILAGEIDRCCRNGPAPVHFVTHSMGGILVRAYLARNAYAPLGRVVMLSPPNQGSELVDAFGDNPLYELILGPAAQELGTDEEHSVPRALPAVDFELGVITGDATLNPIGAWLIPGENDGAVSVERARVAGMKDFLVVPASHTFIMQNPEAVKQVLHFLEQGRFEHPAE